MANTVSGIHLGPDTHANRPAATSVTAGTLYSCSDHDLIYRSDGSAWSTWATLGGGGASLGAWTAYTPTWASSGGTTSVGDGSLIGRYKELDANTVAIQISLAWGSTTSSTGTSWSFSLPAGMTSIAGPTQILAGHILDSGTDNKLACGQVQAGATTIDPVVPEGANTAGPTNPMTWANGDALNLTGIIEIA